MIAATTDDDGVGGRAATAIGGTGDGLGYAVQRARRPRPRLVPPAVALGTGLVLGGGALLVLQPR